MIPKFALIGLAAVSLGSGAVAGALLFSPVVSGAQTDTTVENPTGDDATDSSGSDDPARDHGSCVRFRGRGLGAAAEAIGITVDELREALRDGQTIADVAEANDVDVQAVVDALVAQRETKIDELVADGRIDEERAAALKETLPDRVTAMVNGERPAGFGGPGHGPRGRRGPGFFDAADGGGDAPPTRRSS